MTSSPFPSNGRHGETIGSWKYSILAFGWILWLLFHWRVQRTSRWRLRLSRQTVVTTMALRNHYSCFCNNFQGRLGKSCFCEGDCGEKKATLNINKIRIPLLFSNEATNCASMREYWFKQTMVATIHSFKKLLTPILHILVFRKKGQSGFQYR